MNYNDHVTNLILTALIWIIWCLVHSLTNSEGPIRKTRIPKFVGRYYRLLYNLFAIASLVLVSKIVPKENIVLFWAWTGPFILLQVFLWALAIFVFYLSFRCFDIWAFLGIALRSNLARSAGSLINSGIYGIVRHPQFLAGLILIWARDLTDAALVTNMVLSLYLIIGSKIEESRLLKRFGGQYQKYMNDVPAFIPMRIPEIKSLMTTVRN